MREKTQLEIDLSIDIFNLDEELQKMPQIFEYYSSKYAEAKKIEGEIDQERTICYSKLDKDIRSLPSRYGIKGRATEGTISSIIYTDDEYAELHKKFVEAKYNTTVLKGIVDSLKIKSDSLRNEVLLHGQQYFSVPEVKELSISQKRNKRS
jgi:hypothetical protein